MGVKVRMSLLVMLLLAMTPSCTAEKPLFRAEITLTEIVCNTINKYFEPTSMEKRLRMSFNKKTLIESLPDIHFSDEILGYAMDGLEKLGIGNITSIRCLAAPERPGIYKEGERLIAMFEDDLGSTFNMLFDFDGYCYSISMMNKEGQISSYYPAYPISDPRSLAG